MFLWQIGDLVSVPFVFGEILRPSAHVRAQITHVSDILVDAEVMSLQVPFTLVGFTTKLAAKLK
jgi:hypothetical protein